MASGNVSLWPSFFRSKAWLEDREMSTAEAVLDLLGCACFGVPGRDDLTDDQGRLIASERVMAERWKWTRYRARTLINDMADDGSIVLEGEGRRRVILPGEPPDIRLPQSRKRNTNDGAPAGLHEIWQAEFGSHARLTDKRSQKYAALWEEFLKALDAPYDLFRDMCRAVKASEFHMSKRQYQLPESILRNPERREKWFKIATEGESEALPEHTREAIEKWGDGRLDRLREERATGGQGEGMEDRAALRAWFDSLGQDDQQEITNKAKDRFEMMGGGSAAKASCFYHAVQDAREATGA